MKPKFSTDIFPLHFETLFPTHPFFGPVFGARFPVVMQQCQRTEEQEDRSAGKQQGGRCSSLVQMQTLFTRSSTNCENPNKGKLQLFSWINLPRNAKTPTGKLQIDMFPSYQILYFIRNSQNYESKMSTFSSGLCVPH